MQLTDLLAKAIASVREGITISDARLPDNPLIYVNDAFLQMTGYSQLEAVNYNCRYLQGPDTDQATVTRIRSAIQEKTPLVVELLNYKKNGEPFWNNLSITPLFDGSGQLTHFIGIQDDITNLRHQRAEREAADRKEAITTALLKGEEKERHRIGMELHDNVAQLLGSAKLYLSMAKNPAQLSEAIRNCNEILDQSIGEVRALSHKLVKPVFSQQHFSRDLQKLVDTFQDSTGMAVNFNTAGLDSVSLTDPIRMVVYRVLQEQLNNIRKYAKASELTIDLLHRHHTLHLSIIDNGVGFEPGSSKDGIGFTNMRTRIESLNGKMTVVSAKDNGVSVQIMIPL